MLQVLWQDGFIHENMNLGGSPIKMAGFYAVDKFLSKQEVSGIIDNIYLDNDPFDAWCACKPGFSVEVDGSCVECVEDTYKTLNGNFACIQCPTHSSTATLTGQVICTCNVGFGFVPDDGGSCVECASGTYKDDSTNSACTSCQQDSNAPAGSVDSTQCSCNIGFSGEHAGSCAECGVDTYKNVNGNGACNPCQLHSSTITLKGQTECTCDAGYAGEQCDESPICDDGKFVNAQNQCQSCPLQYSAKELTKSYNSMSNVRLCVDFVAL